MTSCDVDDIDSTDYFDSLPFDELCQTIGVCELIVDDGRVDFTVYERDGRSMIGQFGLRKPYDGGRLIISPLYVTEFYRREGFATRWVSAILRWATEYTEYPLVEISAQNEKSGGLAQKLGFSMARRYHGQKAGWYVYALR